MGWLLSSSPTSPVKLLSGICSGLRPAEPDTEHASLCLPHGLSALGFKAAALRGAHSHLVTHTVFLEGLLCDKPAKHRGYR